jgi:hypothetical protein
MPSGTALLVVGGLFIGGTFLGCTLMAIALIRKRDE